MALDRGAEGLAVNLELSPRKQKRFERSGLINPTDKWELAWDTTINGRQVKHNTECSIHGMGGARFRFQYQRTTDRGVTWLTFIGGRKGYEAFWAFRPEQVKTVHWKTKTRANAKEEDQ